MCIRINNMDYIIQVIAGIVIVCIVYSACKQMNSNTDRIFDLEEEVEKLKLKKKDK